MTPRGFPNIGHVRDALGVLVPAIKKGKLPPPATAPWEGHVGFPVNDAVIGVQHLARKIATAYELSVGTVIVTFVESLKEAGRVELSGPGQRDFFVELRAEFKAQPRVITAILGHEIAHIFLHHHRVHLAPGLPEEILTDARPSCPARPEQPTPRNTRSQLIDDQRRHGPIQESAVSELAVQVRAPAPRSPIGRHRAGVGEAVPHRDDRRPGDERCRRATDRGAITQLTVDVAPPAPQLARGGARTDVTVASQDLG